MNQIVLIGSSAFPALVAAAGEHASAQITSACSPFVARS
jgi:hypothetical protein